MIHATPRPASRRCRRRPPGLRDHRRQLRVTQRRQRARPAQQQEREHQRRARAVADDDPIGPTCPAAAVPMAPKMPAPMTAPMASMTRSPAPSTRLSDRDVSASSTTRSAMGLRRKRDMEANSIACGAGTSRASVRRRRQRRVAGNRSRQPRCRLHLIVVDKYVPRRFVNQNLEVASGLVGEYPDFVVPCALWREPGGCGTEHVFSRLGCLFARDLTELVAVNSCAFNCGFGAISKKYSNSYDQCGERQ